MKNIETAGESNHLPSTQELDPQNNQAAESVQATKSTQALKPSRLNAGVGIEKNLIDNSRAIGYQEMAKPKMHSGNLNKFAFPSAPTVQELEKVKLKKAFNENRLMVGHTTLDGYFTRLQTQKTINRTSNTTTGGGPAATFQTNSLTGLFGGGAVKPATPSTISVDHPIEPQSGQFFSSAIIVDATHGTVKGVLFAPSDPNATNPNDSKMYARPVGHLGRARQNQANRISPNNTGALVVKRIAGHMQLKNHAVANNIIPVNIGKEGAKDRLWGGGFKIESAVVTNPDGTKTKQSWITVSYSSGHLNHGGPSNLYVPEDVQGQFGQAMADLTGLPVYANGVNPFKAGSSPLTMPHNYSQR